MNTTEPNPPAVKVTPIPPKPQKHVLFADFHSGVARVIIPESHGRAQLDLHWDGGIDEGAYYPPQHINLYGEEQIRRMRDLCSDAILKINENLLASKGV